MFWHEPFAAWDRAARVGSSLLLYPETRAAVARATRTRPVPASRAAAARRLVEWLWQDVDQIAPTEALARRAGDLAESQRRRGYDAVHLASLEEMSVEDPVLLSADTDLLRAAGSLGFATIDLSG